MHQLLSRPLLSRSLLSKSLLEAYGPVIEYLMGMTTINTVRYLSNTGTSGANNNGITFGSNWLDLNGINQSFDVDLPHTLGSELATSITLSGGTGNTLVDNLDGTYTLTITNNEVHSAIRVNFNNAFTADNILVTFDIALTSGTSLFTAYNLGTSWEYIASPSSLSIDETINSPTRKVELNFNSDTSSIDQVYTLSNVSAKEITNDNAYLNKIDYATKEVVSIANQANGGTLPVSTVYNETEPGQEWFTTTKTLTDADRAYWTANPNAVRRLWAGELVPELSFTKTDMYSYYPANEGEAGGEFVQDVMQDLGVEKIINPYFDTDTIWVKTTGWTISAGEAIYDGTGGTAAIVQSNVVSTAGLVLLKIVVTENNGTGDNTVWIGANLVSNTHLNTGTHYIIAEAAIGNIWVYGRSGEVFRVSEVSVKSITAAEIANYTLACRTNLKNVNYGASNRLTKQDSTGRITGIADVYSGEYQDPDSRDDTQWDGTGYGYVEEVYHDGTDLVHFLYLANGDRYKNSVSDGTFTMKALVGGSIHLDEKSFDGVATTIVQRGVFRMSKSTLSSQAKIDAVYSEAVELYTTYLTDESGNYLTDESDNYLVAEQKLTPL